jgi:DNA-binding MarR family transcriptional regulator/GNAT superfamily N-acetyltransferase
VEQGSELVRQFNRYYTERIGVLSDHYLGQGHPLAEARLLFEIGPQGRPVRDLRTRLGFDSGYLARLLRSLERQGLVAVTADPGDRRARIATLTSDGTRELQDLNARSDAASRELLAPLPEAERSQLLAAMTTIHRLLRRAEVTVEAADPASADAQRCLLAYAAELDERFPEGFRQSDLITPDQVHASGGACLVARDRHGPLGCGILHQFEHRVAEIRHLWVRPDARGLGVARLLLAALEQAALERGWPIIRLDTHEVLTEAAALYRTSGYQEIPPYDANPHAYLWFEKRLG